jgi:hypothetical protein
MLVSIVPCGTFRGYAFLRPIPARFRRSPVLLTRKNTPQYPSAPAAGMLSGIEDVTCTKEWIYGSDAGGASAKRPST